MASPFFRCIIYLLIFCSLPLLLEAIHEKGYIVTFKSGGLRDAARRSSLPITDTLRSSFKAQEIQKHKRFLQNFNGKTPIQHYTEIGSGFVARLTAQEANELRDDPDVMHVEEDKVNYLYTSRSHEFLGANNTPDGIWRKTTGTDTIIGVIDTGVIPESPSFSGTGFGPPPSKFKGTCSVGTDTKFKCTNKLIGARFFGASYAASSGKTLQNLVASCGDYNSPRDLDGHGTHCAGIAAGSIVSPGLALNNGVNMGTLKGAAFGARLIVYKVFWCGGGAYSGDILSAMDAGVADGVDVLSLSLGSGPDYSGADIGARFFYAYKATLAGVSVVYATGNDGHGFYTVGNASPWMMTVGASWIDRGNVGNKVILANGTEIIGYAVTNNVGTPNFFDYKMFPIADASKSGLSGVTTVNAELCLSSTLDPAKVSGKVVLCLRGTNTALDKATAVQAAGGIGMINYNSPLNGNYDAPNTTFPSISILNKDGLLIKDYVSKNLNAGGAIGNFVNTGSEAPVIATFSSVGPNVGAMNILKPDVTAPGYYIWAATAPKRSATGWIYLSGTSMACPHVAGYVALLRALYPTWKPSMYFSALMTTATQTNNKGLPIRYMYAPGGVASPFSMGAGNVNPNNAADPGLVYPIQNADYQTFLCSMDSGLRYSQCTLGKITRAVDLNRPSILFYNSSVNAKVSTVRTMQNVGPSANYFATVMSPAGSLLRVNPQRLAFSKNKILSYSISIVPQMTSANAPGSWLTYPSTVKSISQLNLSWTFGSITWTNNKGHSVRIVVALNAK